MNQANTLYNLTSAQQLLLYSQKFCIKKSVNNIATSILFNESLDFELLKKSIKEAVNRNDAMRLRLIKSDNIVKQYFVPTEDKEVDYKDFSGCSENEMEHTILGWSGKSFKMYHSSLNKIKMFKSFDGWCGIFMCVHHTTMDSYSIMMFYKDVMDIYFSYKKGTQYPKPLSSYIEVLNKEHLYEENSKTKQDDIEFWQEKFKQPEPIFTDMKGSYLLEKSRKKTKNPNKRTASIISLLHVNARHEIFHVDKEMKEKMIEFCNENKTTIQSLLMMALRTHLTKMNQAQNDISFNSTVARRGTIQEKKCGGTRVICFPFRTIIDNNRTFLDGVCEIRDSFNQHLRHCNMSFMEIIEKRRELYGINQMETYESISLTYSPVQIKFDNMECRSKWHSNKTASANIYLTVMHNIQNDGLDFYFEYKVAKYTSEELKDIFKSMFTIIEIGIENPDIKICDLLGNNNVEESINENGSSKAGTFA